MTSPKGTTRVLASSALCVSLLLSGSPAVAATPPGGTLTIAVGSGPTTLDPSTGEAANEAFFTIAYDSLISFGPDGTYQPGLATSWKWIGSDFKTIEFQLRKGVKFSDGSSFDAKAVKGWLDLQMKNKSPVANNLGTKAVQVTSPYTVRLTMADANPLALLFLSRSWLSGVIPCPKAAANPALLKTATCGAGPYVLDPKQTVTGDTYTYVANPNYWNPARVQWRKVILKVIANPQAALDAVRAGQVQVTGPAQPSLLPSALAAGLKSVGVPLNVASLDVLDKGGTLVPALKDVRVRQALNYAVDRQALSAALGGGQGGPVSTQFLQGSDGFDASLNSYYTYDVAKAKQLLADAGYPQGFELTILSTPLAGLDTMAQAVAGYWQAIGVKAKLDTKPAVADFFAGLTSGKYPVSVAGLGATTPTLVAWNCCFRPGAVWTPDKTAVPELEALIRKLRATDPTKTAPVAKQINSYLTKNAWYVPVYSNNLNYVYDPKKVIMPTPSGAQPVVNLVDIKPVQ
ncbi:peptide ABC transporter substrate-binding protein [Deinococcus sp. KSM4-11]|uniref:ABC transporter substrate-binding protein n=1 Tax=Deinococcus sp. KSM4-11 TaxID=2568654 RepID=UPI0010A452DE|nr:ABC transporter substrate-binding protein [Deinococcus sp. KSM4-11]THF85483.1 peptide ABC transporter substrate-binding protein [Deinococcus sp. KSM4-11]